jgi:hypothetical protein
MHILAVISGEYGRRHVENLRARGPQDWQIETWQAPAALPPVMDDPADFLPASLPQADLILAFGEDPAIAELIPEIARMTGARAVIAPVDREEWLPRGLARQLRGWLERIGVACVTPKPLCSLTESSYNVRQHRLEYDNALIADVAQSFGQPRLKITVDPTSHTITSAEVERDAFCGCAHHVAQGLVGLSADDAEEQAGLLHHHYPCLAGMARDLDFNDTLMHVSGNILKTEVSGQVKPYVQVSYIVPGDRVED